nr:unnamed protein product [Naegleria fowleri]
MKRTTPSILQQFRSSFSSIHPHYKRNHRCNVNHIVGVTTRNYRPLKPNNFNLIHLNFYQTRNITSYLWSKIGDNLQKQITEWISAIQKEDQHFSQPQPLLLPLNFENQKLSQRNDPKNQEITIYIKGFLASHTSTSNLLKQFKSGEHKYAMSADESHFQSWKNSHEILCLRESHRWSSHAKCWQWESGKLPHQFDLNALNSELLFKKDMATSVSTTTPITTDGISNNSVDTNFNPLSFTPVPIATLTFAGLNILNAVRKSKYLFSAASLTALPAMLLTDVALSLAMAYYEFQKANENAKEYAIELSKELHLLKAQYGKVRVVAHSLGCKHLIEALKLMPVELRPDEVHLCAPAISEEEAQEILVQGVSTKNTFHYYSPNDYLLSYIFPIVSSSKRQALGVHEMKSLHLYANTRSLKVCEHFDGIWVHNMYGQNFYKFAISAQ